jgi:SAM-dependent methyltransferase
MKYYTEQERCRISGEPLTQAKTIASFEQLPVPGLFFDNPETGIDKKVPLTVVQSQCGFIQTKENIQPDLYFYYKSRQADQSHIQWNQLVANQIASRYPTSARILEVGGGEGLLLKDLHQKGFRNLNNVDPSHENENQAYFEPITGLFPDALSSEEYSGTFDCIVGMHFLEHVPDPVWVLQEASRLLNNNGECWIEVPDMESSALQSYFQIGIIYPLHINYFTRSTLQMAGKKAGMQLASIEIVNHYGNSLWAKFTKNQITDQTFEDSPEMVQTIERYFHELREFAGSLPKEILAWGAAERALTTYAILSDHGIRLKGLFDSNPEIHGMYVSGVDLPISSPDEFPADAKDLLILSPPNHVSIINGIKHKLHPDITIHVPFIGHLTLSDYV